MESQFDDLAALYDEMASWPFRRDMEIPNVLATLGDVSGRDILDFGCGNGMYSRWLKERGARRVTGYDVSDGMLNYARRREEKDGLGITFTQNLSDLDGQFDIVLAVYVLPYATTHEGLHELCVSMARPLRRGGRLIALPIHPDYARDPSYYEPYGLRLAPEGPDVDGGRVQLDLCLPPHESRVTAYVWSKESLDAALYAAGLGPVQWVQYGLIGRSANTGADDFMEAYWRKPHAAILNCQLR
ncbi:class I SAM-dependent methyltransferase [Paraburkholderia lacunae]|uniref:Class I SAM-dependent methyltransferase n=1 Tax=Paraburkholderia lacunae TaxID=2211104 RepID=A0A370NBK6_9BURK|nr:class I SAM-dependent methyltransferase [Paraburkholderia lacunae]RDK02990.1 class I SAM-dependent methyltransferase [Paraburkholderia lacunae]